MLRSLQANIFYLYLIKLSKWLMLIMPIVVLFYTENGLGPFDIYLLQALYSLSVAFLEIPSGYLADIIGRRTALIAGSLLGTLGFAVLSLSSTLPGFMLAEIILGLGGSFISGSDSALLYDSLAARNEAHYYLRFEGRITALGNLAETVAAIGGGLLAAWLSYRAVYASQTLVASIAIPAALLIVEPEREKLSARPSLRQILAISHQALFEDKKLSSIILMSAITGTATLCMAWTSQVYFVTVGFSETEITPLWVILNLAVAVVSGYAAAIVARFGERRALFCSITMLPLGYILLGSLPVIPALFALFVFYLVRGFTTPMLRDLINRNCRSGIRATVLSIRSLLVRLAFSIVGPLIGLIAGRASLGTALVLFGLILALASIAGAIVLRRHHAPSEQPYQR